MNRLFRKTGLAACLLLVSLVGVAACQAQPASPGISPSMSIAASTSARPQTPAATPRLPTPVPTILPASTAPGPTDPPASPAALVIRLTTCSDTCGPLAGTTIMADGQVIWQDAEGRVLASRLTPAGRATVRDRIDRIGLLVADGNFQAQLRPGSEPLPRGTTSYRFEVPGEGGVVEVTSGEPNDFSTEPNLWIVPAEMVALAALAAQLKDPVAWLGVDALADPVRPYVPDRYLVVVDLLPDIGAPGGVLADVDDVDWPFGNPIESVGDPVGPGEDAPAPRCLIVDGRLAAATASAESVEGVVRDLRLWSFSIEYAWRRADGLVQVTLIQLLPHETGPCADLVLSPP